jgi:VWFA-related protein
MAIQRNFVCGLVLAGLALVWAQSPSPAPAGVSTRLVRLRVNAVDEQGKPADLTADDIRVTDQGKAQRIVLFRREGTAASAPNEFSNRPAAARRPVTVVLLDLLNQGTAEQMNSVKEVGRALQETESGDSLYLYVLTMDGTLDPIRPISTTGSPADSQWTKQADSLLDKARKDANRTRPRGLTQEMGVKKTYVALETLTGQLAAFPGRRNIVWITNQLPTIWESHATSTAWDPVDSYVNPMGGIGALSGLHDDRTGKVYAEGDSRCKGDWMGCSLYLPHLTLALEKASIAVYPISLAGALDPNYARGMEEFANMTGGRSFVSKTVGAAIKQAADDGRAGSYVVAYAPPPEFWNGKYHHISVTSARKGVSIEAPQRYLASPDKRPDDVREQAALAMTFNTPFDVDNVGLRATVARAADQKSVRLTIHVSADDLVLAQQGDHFGGQVTVSWVNYSAAGPTGTPGMARLALQLTAAQREAAAKDGIPIVQDVPIDDGVQLVRLFVVDRTTDVAGSLAIPVPPKS